MLDAIAGVPLLGAAFIVDNVRRLISLVIVSTVALIACGMTGAWLGGAGLMKPTARVLIGGCGDMWGETGPGS